MRIYTYDKLESIHQRYRGYVSTKILLEEGFSNRQIAVLVEEGYLEKISHGYYWLAGKQYEKPKDYKCIEVCLSNPKVVICMDSALYYQNAIEAEPEYLSVATARTGASGDTELFEKPSNINGFGLSDNFFSCIASLKTPFILGDCSIGRPFSIPIFKLYQ